MGPYRLSRCDPHLLDLVTWAVLKGCRLFNRVRVEPNVGLIATDRIQAYDFVSLTPAEATQSLLTMAEDSHHFPLLASPYNYAEPLPFFTGSDAEDMSNLNRGSFSFICYMTAALLTAQPEGLHGYLRVLPSANLFTSPAVVAAEGFFHSSEQKDNIAAFHDYVAPVLSHTNTSSVDEFDRAFCHAFGLFRRHAVPLWSPSSGAFSKTTSMKYFEASPFTRCFGREGLLEKEEDVEKRFSGEILGFIPFSDFASHSTDPNATIGFPDDESLSWIQQERHIKKVPQNGCIALQALKDIAPGDIVTVDKNAFFSFDPKSFEWWFGFPYRNHSRFRKLYRNSVPSSIADASDGCYKNRRSKSLTSKTNMDPLPTGEEVTIDSGKLEESIVDRTNSGESGGPLGVSQENYLCMGRASIYPDPSGIASSKQSGQEWDYANDPSNPYSAASLLDPSFFESTSQ